MRTLEVVFLVDWRHFGPRFRTAPASSFCPSCLLSPMSSKLLCRASPDNVPCDGSPVPGHFCTRTETVSSPYPASISTNAVTLLIVSCPMQSSATRLTSSAMTCRWSDHAWLSTTPERRAVPESQTPTNDTPLIETNVLHDGLHPALKALNLPQAGLHAFRHGCNRRWELAGLNPPFIVSRWVTALLQ